MLPHTVSISRLKKGEGMVRSQTQIAEAVRALVMPADNYATADYSITIGQGFKIYVDETIKLKVADKLTDNTGRVFLVKGFREYPGFGGVSHNWAFCEMIGRTS